ncbi:hypothetical protein [Halocola ammonii]
MANKQTEGKRLKEVMGILNIKAPQLASALGYKTPITIYNIVKGKQGMTKRFLESVSKAFPGIDINWLKTGMGKPIRDAVPSQTERKTSSVRTGFFDLLAQDDAHEFLMSWDEKRTTTYYSTPNIKNCDLAISMVGDYFYPKINGGDILFLKELDNKNLLPGSEMYVVVTKKQVLFRNLREGNTDDTFLAFDERPDWEEFELKKSDIEKLFQIKGVLSRITL